MHKVLLVDDEPIILSGIKFLIDWDQWDCKVIGTARNGQQALDSIEQLQPDIVICDINMPVFSGLEVLKTVTQSSPQVVFIMLTNYQEFDMARESMRLKAVDYLLKTQLEAEALEKSLSLAILESDRRKKIAKVNFVEDYIHTNEATLIGNNVKKIIKAKPDEDLREIYAVLNEHQVLSSYALIEFIMDFSGLPNIETFTPQARKQLFEYERDVIEKLAQNFFTDFTLISPDRTSQNLLLFLWNLPKSGLTPKLSQFRTKLASVSNNITQAHLSLLVTDRLSGEDNLRQCYAELLEMENYYYICECELAYYSQLPTAKYETLDVSDLVNKLIPELRSKNIEQCRSLLEKIKQRLIDTPHRRSAAIQICVELYSVLSSVIVSILPPDSDYNYFGNTVRTIHNIEEMLTRTEVLAWLDELQLQIVLQIEELCITKSEIIEEAKKYVLQNVDKRIMLQDVAHHINISPNYLSALFKKQYNQNFVDYINMTKMEHACELIQEKKYRIYEISYMLGFENAYYFTKVFKRHVGLTPTEYQYKLKGDSKDHV